MEQTDRGLFGKKEEQKQCQPGQQQQHSGECGHKQNEGMVEKIKDKLPGGQGGKATNAPACQGDKVTNEGAEKKGLVDKIKEKLPGKKEGEKGF